MALKQRAIVYVDGFNLYYGAVRGTENKWLDLQKYFERLRNADDLIEVKYFTALVHGPSRVRQEKYIAALATLPKVSVIAGRYKSKRAKCRVDACSYVGDRQFPTWEEKRTDVNIAVHMIDDLHRDRCDLFVVVSGDSDLVPPLYKIKSRFPEKGIIVYVPARDRIRGAATEIRTAADKDATLPQGLLKRCQLPTRIPDGAGGFIEKPTEW